MSLRQRQEIQALSSERGSAEQIHASPDAHRFRISTRLDENRATAKSLGETVEARHGDGKGRVCGFVGEDQTAFNLFTAGEGNRGCRGGAGSASNGVRQTLERRGGLFGADSRIVCGRMLCPAAVYSRRYQTRFRPCRLPCD